MHPRRDTIMLIWALLVPFVAAAKVDPYHHDSEWDNKPSEQQSSLYSGNAGIWDDTDWIAISDDELKEAIRVASNTNTNKAKNVILFIGDGMGVSTLAAARLYNAENRNLKQRDIYLTWEKFPHVGLSRTYNVDKSTPDSAGTGTAYLCGVKANYQTIGVTDKVQANDCSEVNEKTKVQSILKESIAEDKWTGVVTTTTVTHASPAASYAHVANRYWEANIPSNVRGRENCKDIATQLVDDNTKIRVILGGGRQMFLPNGTNPDYNNEPGERQDNRNLIQDWRNAHELERGKFVMNKTDFDAIVPGETDYLLGLFSESYMNFEADRNPSEQPSLSEMTEKAIRILQRSPNGYFLFVEGGRIDQSHHDGNAFKALNDTVALSDAVQRAINLTDDKDTLIVVSADHSHVFTFGGYGSFKKSIFDVTDIGLGVDGKPFLQLNYANGPGFYKHRTSDGSSLDSGEVPRKNLSGSDEMFRKDFLPDAGVPLGLETHGGEDVAIFARGPMAHLIHGVHEQNYINRFMKFASCVGRDSSEPHCINVNVATTTPSNSESNGVATKPSIYILFVLLAAIITIIRQMSH